MQYCYLEQIIFYLNNHGTIDLTVSSLQNITFFISNSITSAFLIMINQQFEFNTWARIKSGSLEMCIFSKKMFGHFEFVPSKNPKSFIQSAFGICLGGIFFFGICQYDTYSWDLCFKDVF